MLDIAEPRSLLEIFTPPPNARFQCGTWFTHDLDGAILSDIVLPTLARVDTASRRRRRIDMRAALIGGERDEEWNPRFIVVGAAGRPFRPGPALPPPVKVATVSGRRQHAKWGYLRFVRGERVSHRLVITTANLTSAGISSNHELTWSWDFERAEYPTRLAAFLLQEAESLLSASQLTKHLAGQRRWLPLSLRKRGTPPPGLHSSISTDRPLLHMAELRPAERLVIVSPAFQGEKLSELPEPIGSWIDENTTVDIVTGEQPDGSTRFSNELLKLLEARAGRVNISAVPVHEPASGDELMPARRLHAKAIAHVADAGVRLFVGSANFTERGLSGRNRELMVELELKHAELDDLLGALPQNAKMPSEVLPVVDEQETDDRDSPGQVEAVFSIEGGVAMSAVWRGTLRLRMLEGTRPNEVRYRGKTVEVHWTRAGEAAVEGFHLSESSAHLQLRWRNGYEERVIVHVEPPTDDAGFWERVPADGAPRQPNALHLIADLRRAAGGGDRTAGSRGGKPTVRDGYHTPLDNRLVELVRARDQLHLDIPGDQMTEAVRRYLGESEAEIACALAIISGSHGGVDPPQHPLLQAAAGAFAAVHPESE